MRSIAESQEAARLRAGPTKAAICRRSWAAAHALVHLPHRQSAGRLIRGANAGDLCIRAISVVASDQTTVTGVKKLKPAVTAGNIPPNWAVRYLAGLANYLVVLQPEARRQYLAWIKK